MDIDLNHSIDCESIDSDSSYQQLANLTDESQHKKIDLVEEDEIDLDNGEAVSILDDNDHWRPICEDDKRPFIGMIFTTVEEGYEFYKQYASHCGFDIRRGTESKHRDGTTLRKHFYCTKAGGISHVSVDPKRKRTSYRTCCRAYMKLRFEGPMRYVVADFIESHNHEMSCKDGSQFLKSRRKLSLPYKSLIVHCSRVNIGGVRAYNLSKQIAGGFENVGAQRADFKKISRDICGFIGDGDAQMVIDKLVHKKNMNNEFYFEYVVEKGVLTRLFWADPISRRNFYAFGDVLSFDATYGTNKYEMIFVPFTGIDNNKKSVIFAAGLLTSEDFHSYVWLLEAFSRCMGRHPKVVLTDEDLSLKSAVPKVFPEAHHRYCMWHIMRKFSMKVGCNSHRLQSFCRKLKAVVYDEYVDIDQFEKEWNMVLEEYEMTGNKWLNDKFEIRQFWIPAYFRDVPLGGLLKTTSRSESVNSFFGRYVNRRMNLVSFFFGYETALESQRHKTMQFEHEAMFKVPKPLTPLKIEKEAMKLYSHAIFNDVQNEILAACFDVLVQSVAEEDGWRKYALLDNRYKRLSFQVCVNAEKSLVTCTCKLFERVGYLCRHAFFGLKSASIESIPSMYVLPRWTKNAVSDAIKSCDFKVSEQCDSLNQSYKSVTDLWLEFQACMSIAGVDSERLALLLTKIREVRENMQCEVFGEDNSDNNQVISTMLGMQQPTNVTIHAPPKVRTKGCGRRIIGDHEKALKKANRALRRCKACGEYATHNTRTCQLKKV